MLNISNLALATPSRVYVLYYAAAVDCGHSHSHSVSHAAVGLVTLSGVRCMTPRRGAADASCAPVPPVPPLCLPATLLESTACQLAKGCGREGGGRTTRVAVIVARVLQLPAFDYNAPHVGVLRVCVCSVSWVPCVSTPYSLYSLSSASAGFACSVHAGIVCTDNTLSALVYPAR